MPEATDTLSTPAPTALPARRDLIAACGAFLAIRGTAAALAQEPAPAVVVPYAGSTRLPAFAEPDAALIALCEQHIRNIHASDNSEVDDYEDDPAWDAYDRSRRAVCETPALTMDGLAAKARASKAEAFSALTDGTEDPGYWPAVAIAWSVVNDLLRLHGGERVA